MQIGSFGVFVQCCIHEVKNNQDFLSLKEQIQSDGISLIFYNLVHNAAAVFQLLLTLNCLDSPVWIVGTYLWRFVTFSLFSLFFVHFVLTSPADVRNTTCDLLLLKLCIKGHYFIFYHWQHKHVSGSKTNFILMHNHHISGQKETAFLCSFSLFTCFYSFFLWGWTLKLKLTQPQFHFVQLLFYIIETQVLLSARRDISTKHITGFVES